MRGLFPAAPHSLIEKLSQSETKITVNYQNRQLHTTFSTLIKKAKEDGRPIVFTLTPGPFKAGEAVPNQWMETEGAVGCTAQLNALNKVGIPDLYAINIHSNEYQYGSKGLLASKGWKNFQMISATPELRQELGLDTIQVGEKEYLKRQTIVFAGNGQAKVLTVEVNDKKAVDENTANKHFDQVKAFLAENALNNVMTKSMSC